MRSDKFRIVKKKLGQETSESFQVHNHNSYEWNSYCLQVLEEGEWKTVPIISENEE